MKKKTPKSSNKKRKKTNEKQENIIIIGIFIVFIAVVAYLFYFVNIQSFNEDIVAVVNGDKISRDSLDWWYKVSILPEYTDLITKQDFLMLSLIPQEILMQEAKKNNIKATNDEVEKLLGLFITENGLTLNEFEEHLKSRDLAIEDIKKSFETRAAIIQLFEKENVVSTDNNELLFDTIDNNFQEYVDNSINNSKVEIFQENIDKFVLRSFEETNDEVCDEDKPIIRMYTTISCQVCKESGILFQDLVIHLIADGSVQARHWSLDSGDNLLTSKKENGIPEEEVAIFKKYSPDKLVPVVVAGCKYKHIGKFSIDDKDEFQAILKTLIGE